MIKIHTSDGKTTRVDLNDNSQARELLSSLRQHNTQKAITGVSVVQAAEPRMRCPSCSRTKLKCEHCKRALPSASHASIGVQYSLSRPDGFGDTAYLIEHIDSDSEARIRGGERVTCLAGDTKLVMMVHSGQPSVRFTLVKTGQLRYNPQVGR